MTQSLDRLTDALQDRYTIERELGQGGMATVYLAEDRKHRRKVALKVLRPDLAATLGPDRFLREITVAANLQHPHVLPLYDSGEAEGFLFYVMPYVDGPSLRQKLVRDGELPVGDAARILRDVADALAYAHQQGVVHRDIKPENVMLSGRHALVTDFGVAKAVSEATGRQQLTTAGVALGTPAYMAPEQAAADPHTDHRADLYAFGVTAYEMLTGQPPFVGASPQAVLAAHVTEAPVAVTQRRATIPPALAQVIMRCLEKKPADRPQRAEELLPVLELAATPSGGITPTETQPVRGVPVRRAKRWSLVAVVAAVVLGVGAVGMALLGPQGRSAPVGDVREPVVVIPFEVQASDAQLASLGRQAADRIAGAITAAGLGGVVPYPATDRVPGGSLTPEIGARVVSETGAATLVTGVIYQRGDSLEVQAQLLRGHDLRPLFSLAPERGGAGSPEGPVAAITQRVLGAVGRYLSPAGRAFDVTLYHPPSSLESFRLFDKASEGFRLTFGDSATRALLLAAFRLDTTLFMAAIDLAASYMNYGDRPTSDSILAELEARRSQLAVGEALFLDHHQARRRSPEEEYRVAIALLEADSGWTYDAMISSVYARRPEEGLRYYARRDTNTVWARDWQVWERVAAEAYHALGRFEEEVTLARAARSREPSARAHWEREARALAALGRTDELGRLVDGSYTLEDPRAPGYVMGLAAQELQDHGYREPAETLFQRTLAWIGTLPPGSQPDMGLRNLTRTALRGVGRYEEVQRLYAEDGRDPRTGLGHRALAAREAVRSGDTTGALAMVDSLRSAPNDVLRATWPIRPEGDRSYFGAHILALLGRGDEAVAWLRQALNSGRRLGPDEALQWYWEPIREYPPFQELVRVKG